MRGKAVFGLWLAAAFAFGFIHFMGLAILVLDFYVNGTFLLCTTPVALGFLIATFLITRPAPKPARAASGLAIVGLTALFAIGWFCGNAFLAWTYPPNFS